MQRELNKVARAPTPGQLPFLRALRQNGSERQRLAYLTSYLGPRCSFPPLYDLVG